MQARADLGESMIKVFLIVGAWLMIFGGVAFIALIIEQMVYQRKTQRRKETFRQIQFPESNARSSQAGAGNLSAKKGDYPGRDAANF